MWIDLHIHSTASDGTLSPAEILAAARRLHLKAIALTDHDTVQGVRQLIESPLPGDIQVLTGVEISAAPPLACPRRGSFHILGYGLDVHHRELNQTLIRLQNARQDRNPAIIARLRAMGIEIELTEAEALAENRATLGRPHIARVLRQKGWAASIDEAFDRYLGNGRPAYVDKFRIDCAEAMALIRRAGGLPVLAHPGMSIPAGVDLDAVLASLIPMGLAGIEVYYPEHDAAQTGRYAAAARRHGLLMTGGSDFHGDLKPRIALGSGSGDLRVPMRLYLELRAALAAHQGACGQPCKDALGGSAP